MKELKEKKLSSTDLAATPTPVLWNMLNETGMPSAAMSKHASKMADLMANTDKLIVEVKKLEILIKILDSDSNHTEKCLPRLLILFNDLEKILLNFKSDVFPPEVLDYILLKKNSWEGHIERKAQVLTQIGKSIFFKTLNIYLKIEPPMWGGSVALSRLNFFKKISTFKLDLAPFYLYLQKLEELRFFYANLLLKTQMNPEGFRILKNLLQETKQDRIYWVSLELLLEYFLELCKNKTPSEMKELIDTIKPIAHSLEKTKDIRISVLYYLGYFFHFLGEKVAKKNFRFSHHFFLQILEAKPDPEKFHKEINAAASYVGEFYINGISGYLPVDLKKGAWYLNKATMSTLEGQIAQDKLLHAKLLLNDFSDLFKLAKKLLIHDMPNANLIMALFPEASENLESYLQNLDHWVARGEEALLLQRQNFFLRLSNNLFCIYLNNGEKYPQTIKLLEKYYTLAGEIKDNQEVTNSLNGTKKLELLKLIESKNSVGVSQISLPCLSFELSTHVSHLMTLLTMLKSLASQNKKNVQFRYQLRNYIPHMNLLFLDLYNLFNLLIPKISILSPDEFFNSILDLASLPFSPNNKNFNNLLTFLVNQNRIVLQDEPNFNIITDIFYHLAVIGFTYHDNIAEILMLKWLDLDTGHKFLLFYSFYLYHVQHINNPVVKDTIVAKTAVLAKKLDSCCHDKTFDLKENILATQVTIAYKHFSMFEPKSISTVTTLYQNFRALGIHQEFNPHESKMQTKVIKNFQSFYPGEIIPEYVLTEPSGKQSAIQIDGFLEEIKTIQHVEGLTHYLFVKEKDDKDDGLELAPKTKARDMMIEALQYKSVIKITSDEVNYCESWKGDEMIFYFKLFHEKCAQVGYDLRLKDAKLFVTNQHRLSAPSEIMKKNNTQLRKLISEKIVQLTNPELRQAYDLFFRIAQADNCGKSAYIYLLNQLNAHTPSTSPNPAPTFTI